MEAIMENKEQSKILLSHTPPDMEEQDVLGKVAKRSRMVRTVVTITSWICMV